MEKKPLVSLITPCHNSSSFIYRLMDSVLQQTYDRIEMIAVDNDSEDNTAQIIKDYIPKFESKGYILKYIHQDNLGPSAGIQTGLRVITGDYLLMPDSDDYYSKATSIETFVNQFIKLSDNYAIIRCQLQYVDEKDMSVLKVSYEGFPEDDPGTLFKDCLLGQNNYNFAPIGYMVKVSCLREMTDMSIYHAFNVGQQRQICLPLYYKYKAWTIPEVLACYLVRNASVSHGDYGKLKTQAKLYEESEKYIDTIFETIKEMPENEKKYYKALFLRQQAERMALRADKAGGPSKPYIEDYKHYGGSAFKLKTYLLLLKIVRPLKEIIYNKK